MCYGYCATDITIDKKRARLTERAHEEKRKYPDLTAQRKPTKEEWGDLQQSIDLQAQAALTGRIGDPGAVDEVTEWIEVEFSDGTKKSVFYNKGDGPPAVIRLEKCIDSIRSRFAMRIPPTKYE